MYTTKSTQNRWLIMLAVPLAILGLLHLEVGDPAGLAEVLDEVLARTGTLFQ